MSNWSSEFKKFCKGKITDEDTQLWREVTRKLMNSLELGENLFPKTVVGTVVITLNGRIIATHGTGEESKETYYYGLNPEDLTAINGVVRLTDRYTKKKFETKTSSNIQKSFEFMLSFLRRIRFDAYTQSLQLSADKGILEGALSMHNIKKITVNSNPILCTLDLVTGDYVLARDHIDDYLKCVRWQNPEITADIKPYVISQLEMNTVDSVSDSIDYYLQRGSRKHVYMNEFTTFFTLPKGLTDIVPVAVKFPEDMPKVTQSGVKLVNNLDNEIFDLLCSTNSIPMNNVYCHCPVDVLSSNDTKVQFHERLCKFQESVRAKVFSAPSLNGSFDSTVQVACASKKDIFELTDIHFSNYSFGVMNFILSCMLKSGVGTIMPYSTDHTDMNSDELSPFSRSLKTQILSRSRQLTLV